MRLRLTTRQLIASWVLYWIVLLLVAAWRPLVEFLRLQLTGAHGSVSFSFDGSMLSLALWVAGPPLLLFLAWLPFRSRAGEKRERAAAAR